jgi:uncharacterized membrane protein
MNKSRIEAFSDGVFSVAMTLLVIGIKIPIAAGGVGDRQVAQIFAQVWPLVLLYMVSFFVLSVLWTNHHFIFHAFAKEVNRQLNLLNMTYLMFVVLVPFSVQFISTYSDSKIAVIVYGVNIFIIVFLSTAMTRYIRHNKELLNPLLSQRTIRQAQFRAMLSLLFYPLGIVFSFVWIPASFFFYTFPVIFNVIPGTLDFVERHSPLNFD